MKNKTKYDPVFKAVIIEVEDERFSYKREGQRDKWWCYFNQALPEGLSVEIGEKYKCRNKIETDFHSVVSWKIEFKESK